MVLKSLQIYMISIIDCKPKEQSLYEYWKPRFCDKERAVLCAPFIGFFHSILISRGGYILENLSAFFHPKTVSVTGKLRKNHCGFGYKSGQNLLKVGDDPRFGLSMPKNPCNKTTLGLAVLMDFHFSQSFSSNFELSSHVQLVMSYKYSDTFTKNVLIDEYPAWTEWQNIF